MRKVGILLIILGIIWGIVAFNMQTTIVTKDQTIGNGALAIQVPSMEVNNIGLLDRRRNHLLIASVFGVIGIMLFGFGSLKATRTERSTSNGEMKKCPFCAESIQAAAIKCRHCGSEIKSDVQTPKTQGDLYDPYVKPLPAAPKRNKAIPIVTTVVILLGIALIFPTTVPMDRTICTAKARLSGAADVSDHTSGNQQLTPIQAWRKSIKVCMEDRGRIIKSTVLGRLPSSKPLADAKAKLAIETNPVVRDMYKKMIDIYEETFQMEQAVASDDNNNWE